MAQFAFDVQDLPSTLQVLFWSGQFVASVPGVVHDLPVMLHLPATVPQLALLVHAALVTEQVPESVGQLALDRQ